MSSSIEIARARTPLRSNTPWKSALWQNWRLYAFEASELALFMLSACCCSAFLFYPFWHVSGPTLSETTRKALMSVAMGATAVLIIRSPMGVRSGAHFNPAVTLTYFRLGKIKLWDTIFYIAFQFIGAVLGVAAAVAIFGAALSYPSVNYVITVPGRHGTTAAFIAELFMATLLMAAVLLLSNNVKHARYVSYAVGVLNALYAFVFATISGVSTNPARTTGSALFAGVWTAVWVYFVAPLLGMVFAAEMYVRFNGKQRVLCAKLHPESSTRCPFNCSFPHPKQR